MKLSTAKIKKLAQSIWDTKEFPFETCYGISKPTPKEMEEVKGNIERGIFEASFKYMSFENIDSFLLDMGISYERTVNSNGWYNCKTVELYSNPERTLFFVCECGKIGDAVYSALYATDFDLGLEKIQMMLSGEIQITYIKAMTVFHNGLSNFDSDWVKEVVTVPFQKISVGQGVNISKEK